MVFACAGRVFEHELRNLLCANFWFHDKSALQIYVAQEMLSISLCVKNPFGILNTRKSLAFLELKHKVYAIAISDILIYEIVISSLAAVINPLSVSFKAILMCFSKFRFLYVFGAKSMLAVCLSPALIPMA